MRHYQPTRCNPYQLPHSTYMRAYYLVCDYDRLQKQITEIPFETPAFDGQPRGSDIAKPAENMAIRMEQLSRQCRSVEQALKSIPEEYRRGILSSILGQGGRPLDAHPNTYSRWRCRFLWEIARNEGMI